MRSRTFLASIVVVAALWTSPAAQTPAFGKDTFDRVRVHLKDRQFDQAMSVLAPFVAPADAPPTPVYLMGLVSLQAGRLSDAQSSVDRLRRYGTAEASAFADKLAPVLKGAIANEAVQRDFAVALKNFDAPRAEQLLTEMDITAEQRAAVGVYIDAYRGKLTTALLRLSAPEIQPLAKTLRDQMRQELVLSTGRYRNLTEQLSWYTENSLATGACQPADARERSVQSGLLLAEYVRLTQLALELFPFNDRFMDGAFHGALLSASYEDLERLGDSILKAKGVLRVPFFSSNARFWLVIDARSQRLSTEFDLQQPSNVNGSDQLGELVPFDHPFASVSGIHQRAKNMVSTGSLLRDSYALKVDPRGQAPHYLFMPLVHCLYGEATQKQITKNLGLYLIHVISARRAVAADLENPDKVTKERLQMFSQIIGVSTSIVANAASQLQQAPQKDDGRITSAEVLQQTASEGQLLATRRNSLLKEQASIGDAQAASRQTWFDSLANSAVAPFVAAMSARVDGLLALVDIK